MTNLKQWIEAEEKLMEEKRYGRGPITSIPVLYKSHAVALKALAILSEAIEYSKQHASDYNDAIKDSWMIRHEQLESNMSQAIASVEALLAKGEK